MLNDSLSSKCNLKINENPQYLPEIDGEAGRFLWSNFEMWFNSAENQVRIVYQCSENSVP